MKVSPEKRAAKVWGGHKYGRTNNILSRGVRRGPDKKESKQERLQGNFSRRERLGGSGGTVDQPVMG